MIKLKLIDESDIKKEELEKFLAIESDVICLNELVKDFAEITKLNSELINTIDVNVQETTTQVIESNNNLIETNTNLINYKKTKLVLAGIGLLCLNVPLGLAFGSNVLAGTIIGSSIGAGFWITRK